MNKKKIIYNKYIKKHYIIKQKFKTGIVLKGWEVKSIFINNIDIKNSYIKINKKKEIYLINSNIFNNFKNKKRHIKLLLKKKEIKYLYNKSLNKGYTIMLLSIIIKKPWYKCIIALCKGLKLYNKKDKIKYKTWNI